MKLSLIHRHNSDVIKFFLAFLIFQTGASSSFCFAQDNWLPVRDVSLLIEPNSILDFSALAPSAVPINTRLIVNKEGHLAKAAVADKSLRFLMGSLGFGVSNGGFPSHDLADLYVKQYRLHGYNMVRLDFVEATLMEGRIEDFDFNPTQLDRFYYLLSVFKKNGFYFVLNGLSSDNGGYGNVKERWVGQKKLMSDIYYDAEKQQHWKALMKTMLGSVNPYTGLSTLQDPALAGLILVNENGLAFVNRLQVPEPFRKMFASWLKEKYGSTLQLQNAWGRELKKGESLNDANIVLSSTEDWPSARTRDSQMFYTTLERKTADWMTAYLRDLGYRGLVTAYNNWLSPAANVSRSQFDWVDMHDYFAHPDYITGEELVVRQDSMLEHDAGYVRELAVSKHLGKAFTVSEFGQVFWNQYRRESTLAIPAYAAFQQWDAICQHSGALALSYADNQGKPQIIQPFAVGLDPIARATETLAALLFLRGDVKKAHKTIAAKLTSKFVYEDNSHLGGIIGDISKLSLVTGLVLKTGSNHSTNNLYDAEVTSANTSITLTDKGERKSYTIKPNFLTRIEDYTQQYSKKLAPKISKIKYLEDNRWTERVENLRHAGLLTPKNLTDTSKGIYQTDTGEIMLDSVQKKLTVITPNTEAAVFDEPQNITLKQLKIIESDGAMMLAVSSMDGLPIATSQRMLLVLATDARNSGMRFKDAAMSQSIKLGETPVLLRKARVKLVLKNEYPTQLKLYATNLRGQRTQSLELTQTSDGISFEIDTSKLVNGPSIYFEIAN